MGEVIAGLGSAAVAWPLAARAQQGGKIYRLALLEPIPAARKAANLECRSADGRWPQPGASRIAGELRTLSRYHPKAARLCRWRPCGQASLAPSEVAADHRQLLALAAAARARSSRGARNPR